MNPCGVEDAAGPPPSGRTRDLSLGGGARELGVRRENAYWHFSFSPRPTSHDFCWFLQISHGLLTHRGRSPRSRQAPGQSLPFRAAIDHVANLKPIQTFVPHHGAPCIQGDASQVGIATAVGNAPAVFVNQVRSTDRARV